MPVLQPTAAFQGETVLITGGTGSFGNALVRHLLDSEVAEIRIFSRDEKKQDEMRQRWQSPRLSFRIGDVRNFDSIHRAMRGVGYVFCAAALKQVPSCEFHPLEAVYTNILGTENTLNAASAHGVRKVIVLSTDKAVYPINAMGMSKALMEKVAVAKSRDLGEASPAICATRYGNVMGSRGSVIPLFISQMKAGGPITVTDPEMTRFMMPLDDAVDLVVHAFTKGRTGDTFVHKAPAATIHQLALVLRRIFRMETEIRVIGTRHGEKKHETLLTREEMFRAEDVGVFFRIAADARDLNYSLYFEQGEAQIADVDDYTSANTRRLTDPELESLLRRTDYVRRQLEEGPHR
jgi:UDP-glucose 4-epimerase